MAASACQTAVAEFIQLPDESVGLPAGFLRAGAAAVIGTLWPVDDRSTALLMVRFYEFHLGTTGDESAPMPVARALRLAQRWLAKVTAAELAGYFAEQASPGEPIDQGAGGQGLWWIGNAIFLVVVVPVLVVLLHRLKGPPSTSGSVSTRFPIRLGASLSHATM